MAIEIDSSLRVSNATMRNAHALLLTIAMVFCGGCGGLGLRPDSDIAPSRSPSQVWTPPASISKEKGLTTSLAQLRQLDQHAERGRSHATTYDLPALIEFSLKTNPQTQRAWYSALAVKAQLGQARGTDYPRIDVDAEGGYFKLPIQFPGQTLVIRNEEFLPQIKVGFDLLDFGRTRAVQRSVREQLIGANFAFNQAIQDVVFEVEKSYYVFAAAHASVAAAQANLKLAQTSLDAIEERHRVGLATKPQILLAKQLQAQAVYDLENARSMVQDAEAALCQAIGIAPDTSIAVREGELDHMPAGLGNDVETMMTDTLEHRPDITGKIAGVRAGDAAIDRARAEFYPQVEIQGNYGQIVWSYTVNGGNTQNLNQPFYGALLDFRWNLFSGYESEYGVQKAIAERNAARAELKSLQLNTVSGVWTAYHDFRSAQKKYDASQALVTASQESYNANLESHRYGLTTVTDLIGAERDLMGARFTFVRAKADLLLSASVLLHATGEALKSS